MKRCLNCFTEYPDVFDVCPVCGNSVGCLSAENGKLKPGTVLHQRYFIGSATGAGGFGIIYRSFDLTLKKTVAVKEFCSSRLSVRAEDGLTLGPVDSRSAEEYEFRKNEFLREARFVSDLNYVKCIPSVSDFFEENGTAYIVMEYLRGASLSTYIHEGGCSLDFCLYTAIAVAGATACLHEKGKVHRDIAPDNIFICTEGEETGVRLLDFGAACNAGIRAESRDIVLKNGFSAPEQYNPGKVSVSADVYSLGATLYVMLTGICPPGAEERKNGAGVKCPSEFRPDVPRRLDRAVMKALEANPLKRWGNASEFGKELEKIAGSLHIEYIKEKKKELPAAPDVNKASAESVSDYTESRGFTSPVPERLLPGTLIHERYRIGLGFRREGMCAVYKARDILLNSKVLLTEYFPHIIAVRDNDGVAVRSGLSDGSFRDGLALFTSAAEKLNSCPAGPGSEKIRDLFSENGTAYFVTSDKEMLSLEEWMRGRKKLKEDEVKRLLFPVAAELSRLEKAGICHGNVSPRSIFTDGSDSILCFNSSLCYPGSSLDGYKQGNRQRYWAAPELAAGTRQLAYESDLYSLGAVVYYLVCGKVPPDSAARVTSMMSDGRDILVSPRKAGARIKRDFEKAVLDAMNLSPGQRQGLCEILTEK